MVSTPRRIELDSFPIASAWREIPLEEARAHYPDPPGAAAPAQATPLPADPDPLRLLIGAPPDARQRCEGLDLLVGGVGAIGARCVEHLSGLTPRAVYLVDPDVYTAGNLTSQPIDPAHVGLRKVDVVGRRLKSRSPGTRVFVAACRFEELGLSALQGPKIVLLAGDNLALIAAVAQRSCELGWTVFKAGVHGPTAVAQVQRSATRGSKRVCLCCGWDSGDRRELDRQTRFACDGSGTPTGPTPPTGALSALCGAAAGLLTLELVRWVLGLAAGPEGGDPPDELVEYCALSQRIVVAPLVPNPRCLIPHGPWRCVLAPRPLAELTPREIIGQAYPRSPGRLARRVLELDGWRWASHGLCQCDTHPQAQRFVRLDETGGALGTCRGCGQETLVHPLHLHSRVPCELLVDAGSRPLAELGVDSASAAVVRGAGSPILVLSPDSGPTGEESR